MGRWYRQTEQGPQSCISRFLIAVFPLKIIAWSTFSVTVALLQHDTGHPCCVEQLQMFKFLSRPSTNTHFGPANSDLTKCIVSIRIILLLTKFVVVLAYNTMVLQHIYNACVFVYKTTAAVQSNVNGYFPHQEKIENLE